MIAAISIMRLAIVPNLASFQLKMMINWDTNTAAMETIAHESFFNKKNIAEIRNSKAVKNHKTPTGFDMGIVNCFISEN